ncbi:hypothetical protein D4764_01G0018060 [Takifugu flavidus]|uniref:GHMP kinase N-terminal domain-containing protein n=1 Tax=Takifugu flavidus TaxID=433684 RepID=A0A5C6PT45_9TELE|nr:hypothetical protein D4764_01G0018060 [Takifugu flavidus]
MSSGSSQLAGETSLTDDPPSLFALTKQNFMLRYDTNIPRQVGLAGSSAIVLATLKCLMKFYNITDNDLPKPIRANFILNVETDELFITAGLQDRVVQVYEGLVYMDFSRTLMDEHGYGSYVSMDMGALPPFWLAYLSDPSDSGRIHSNIRQRWLSGEPLVVEAMRTFAELTDQARVALENRDWTTLAQLMDQNFELRRTVYTDECLGPGNLKMVRLAKKITRFLEKPEGGLTASRLASVVFYCSRRNSLSHLSDFLSLHPPTARRSLGQFWEWLVNHRQLEVFGMKLPSGFQLIGQVGLPDYTKWLTHYSTKKQDHPGRAPICYDLAQSCNK